MRDLQYDSVRCLLFVEKRDCETADSLVVWTIELAICINNNNVIKVGPMGQLGLRKGVASLRGRLQPRNWDPPGHAIYDIDKDIYVSISPHILRRSIVETGCRFKCRLGSKDD